MIPFFKWAFEMGWDKYVDVLEHMDPRVDSWFLMSSPIYPITIVSIYLTMCLGVAPFWMKKNANEVNMAQFLIYYNSLILLINAMMGCFLSLLIERNDYSYICQRVRFKSGNINEDHIAEWLWLYHISKILEMFDTVFVLLRRKKSNLTFLHVYHHASIVIVSWIGVRFVPGGQTALIAMINSWVHVIMYLYFKLSIYGLENYFQYKKFCTVAQISQFIVITLLSLNVLSDACGYPSWAATLLLFYMFGFMVIFVGFYWEHYVNEDDNW